METEASNIGDRSDLSASICGTACMSSVLHNAKVPFLGYVVDCIQVTWLTSIMNRNNRLRVLRKLALHVLDAHVQCVLLNVDEDWLRPFIHDDVSSRYE